MTHLRSSAASFKGRLAEPRPAFLHFTDGKTEGRSDWLVSSVSCPALVQLYTELGQNAAGCDWEDIVDRAVLGGANQSGGNSDGQLWLLWCFWLAAARLGLLSLGLSALSWLCMGPRTLR